jgi:DNA-binding transcriptional LysR family regulator
VLFRQLEYLVSLSRERHFARAAQACFVSQPALSEAIRKLEEEFDVPLVRRGRKFEGLTPEGERIVLWAQRILADRDALRHEVGALRTGLSGELRIGSVPTALAVVALIAEPFCAEHPMVQIQVISDLRAEDLLGRLNNFELDAGITYRDDAVTANFRCIPLYEERYVLLTRETSGPASGTSGVTWAEASRLPLCMLSAVMQGRRVLDAVFAELGVQAQPQVETDSVASLYAHVRTGRWASIVPHAWLHVFGMPQGMRAVPLVEPTRTASIGLVVTAREPGSVLARILTDIARRTDVNAALDRLPESSIRSTPPPVT